MAATLDTYKQYLSDVLADVQNKTTQINYQPQSASELKSMLAKALRPGYDKSIASRKAAAKQNNASLDVDAAARGMGSSTWLSDAKNRQNNAAEQDVANLEGDYQANLYNSLLSRLSEQQNNRLNVDQYNASALNEALNRAFDTTNNWWQTWENAKNPSGGGGTTRTYRSTSKKQEDKTDENFGAQPVSTNLTPTALNKIEKYLTQPQMTSYVKNGASSLKKKTK